MRYCSKCGKELNDDQIYCPRCGNKEPFVTNSEKSDWNNFETEKKYDGNVSYDFQNKKVVAIETPEQKQLPKGIKILNKVQRIYGICSTVYFLLSFITSILLLVFTGKVNHWAFYILNWIGLIIFIGSFAIQVARLSILSSNKIKINMRNNVAIPSLIISLFGVGASVGQYFILKAGIPGVLFFLQFMFMIVITLSNSGKKAIKIRI